MFITAKLQFIFQRLKEHLSQAQERAINTLVQKRLLNGKNFIQYLSSHQDNIHQKKQTLLDKIRLDQKIVFYTFRDLHLIDWFIPIHRSLEIEFPDKYLVFYINFGSTLKKAGKGLAYLPYLNQIEKRLKAIPNATFQHFSDQEISLFNHFPKPDLILTTETIRLEKFQANQRIYLPHYTVPKANDTLPSKIKYNHVFLPTTREFSYQSQHAPGIGKVELHDIGYPKLDSLSSQAPNWFENDNPLIIFAPSLDIKLIQLFIKQGILKVFKSLKNLNFVIKLHPTLSTKMHYLHSYLCKELKGENHIRIDTQSNIQDIGSSSALMLTDFGSVGAEYRLSFGKRVIYLDLPDKYEGGADLKFRDSFADSVSTIANLPISIKEVLKFRELSNKELVEMRERVLFNWQDAAKKAAHTIHQILE